jgi:hypothetical protein
MPAFYAERTKAGIARKDPRATARARALSRLR